MKKRAITAMLTFVMMLVALVAFCNYPSVRAVAKDNTEIVTVQFGTKLDTISADSVVIDSIMNGKYVSENWLRNKLRFHGVKEGHIETFILIAKRESTLNPKIVNRTLNRNRTIDSGLFQINSCHKKLYQKYDLLDPEQNLLAALELYRQSGFKPWRSSIGSRAS